MYYVGCRLPLQLKGIVFHFLYTIYIMALPVVQHNWVTLQEELTVSIVSVFFLYLWTVRDECSKGECEGEDEGRSKGLWGQRQGAVRAYGDEVGPYQAKEICTTLHYGLCTTTTVSRIVARDDVHEFSTGCGNFAPKKVTTLCIRIPGPNLIYKISSST